MTCLRPRLCVMLPLEHHLRMPHQTSQHTRPPAGNTKGERRPHKVLKGPVAQYRQVCICRAGPLQLWFSCEGAELFVVAQCDKSGWVELSALVTRDEHTACRCPDR